jgi:hypothetical protein
MRKPLDTDPPASAAVPTPRALALKADEQFDMKHLRRYHTELAAQGCGAPNCPPETCAYARQSRLILRAFAALDRELAQDVRTCA